MREIKFRGKSIDTGEWVYGYYYNIDDSRKGNRRHIIVYESEKPGLQTIHEPVYRETVGQYTGLKDKNGKEICEGDILKLINDAGRRVLAICKLGNRRLTTENGDMIDIQCYYFEVEGRKTNPMVRNYKGVHDLEIMEVIGNIHDNPELLEGEG